MVVRDDEMECVSLGGEGTQLAIGCRAAFGEAVKGFLLVGVYDEDMAPGGVCGFSIVVEAVFFDLS